MAAEHVKTWEGTGWMLSFRDNGHNDDDNDPTRARKRGDISFKSRAASLRRPRADARRRNGDSDDGERRGLSAPYGEDVARTVAVNGTSSRSRPPT